MIVCIDNTVTDTEKFRMLPVTTKYLYVEFCKHRDKRGALSEEQLKQLVLFCAVSKNDVKELLDGGYLLYNDKEEKFYLDAYFHVHNQNLPKHLQKSNYADLIDKYFSVNQHTHILAPKLATTVELSVIDNSIKSNLTQSQYLSTVTSNKYLNTEMPENGEISQSQNINTENKIVNSEMAFEMFKNQFSEAEIVEGFERLQKYRKMTKIRNEKKYLAATLTKLRKQKPKKTSAEAPTPTPYLNPGFDQKLYDKLDAEYKASISKEKK